MSLTSIPSVAFSDTKRHYAILDGLRGVAALMVVAFHFLETHAASRFEQVINHGYLAVDFFFVLSGFVIGYAYDDRWNKMTLTEFFKRRLIRLHPMIIIAMVIGAAMFYFQDCKTFPNIHDAQLWQVLLTMVIGMTLIPLTPSMDVRGWQEMHPLNGPAWSLFFEYVANILYALFIRRFSNTVLAILVFIFGCATIHFTVWGEHGDVIGGWSLAPDQLQIGFTRLMYPFFAGLLLSRIVKPGKIQHAFLICSLAVIAILAMPRIGNAETLWMNGIYEALCIIIFFPLIVYIGASGSIKEGPLSRVCDFLGGISYPIYIIHYPIIYTYMAWVVNNNISLKDGWPITLGGYIASIVVAYLCLKLYDVPVRQWLGKRFMAKKLG